MANSVLFASSIAMAILHTLALLWCPRVNPLLATNVVFGVGTSVWNHGATSLTARVADRAMMWIGFCVDLHLVWTISHHPSWALCAATLVGAAALYWIAKVWVLWTARAIVSDLPKDSKLRPRKQKLSDLPHLCAHVSLTVTHFVLMEALAVAA
ncbi:hypothetical protein PHYBOEH_008807 [Phytophthora boehmeriae]|uniref:Uncharacterized protein n=1 Tax=Phytophthora boehmeriae TaxID=109152 RepID=A0A8T1VYG1_9STRA|nr:hypothetical protein PHYBOEH_008807 [Phytophthora boehmeriae]